MHFHTFSYIPAEKIISPRTIEKETHQSLLTTHEESPDHTPPTSHHQIESTLTGLKDLQRFPVEPLSEYDDEIQDKPLPENNNDTQIVEPPFDMLPTQKENQKPEEESYELTRQL